MSDWLRRLWRSSWDWLVIVSAATLIPLVWLGPPIPRWEQTVFLAALITGYFQLRFYRRWLRNAHRWLDEAHEREAWYRDRWRWR